MSATDTEKPSAAAASNAEAKRSREEASADYLSPAIESSIDGVTLRKSVVMSRLPYSAAGFMPVIRISLGSRSLNCAGSCLISINPA